MYSPFHKTLPKTSLEMHWISVRFYEMGDMWERSGRFTYFSNPAYLYSLGLHNSSNLKSQIRRMYHKGRNRQKYVFFSGLTTKGWVPPLDLSGSYFLSLVHLFLWWKKLFLCVFFKRKCAIVVPWHFSANYINTSMVRGHVPL